MDQILAQVSRAYRRLWVELFLNRLFVCVLVGLVVAVVAIAVPKVITVANLPAQWTWWCAIGGVGMGSLAALVWTLVRGLNKLDAAVELDRRFELRERVSSSLALSSKAAESPAGQALLHDAVRALERVDVGTRFGIHLPPRRWLPVVTTVIAFLLLSLVADQTVQSAIDPQAAAQAKVQRENVSEQLKKRLAERRKKAAEKGLKEAAGLFEQLEKETEKLRQNPEADQKESLVKLNDIAKQLEERHRQVGSKEQMRKSLANLDKLNQGPAEKMADAMQDGDWQKALEELKHLDEQLASGALSDEAKQALAEQLEKLQQALAEAAQAYERSMDDLKRQIEQQQELGRLSEAGQLQQQLDSMTAQQNLLNKLDQLGAQMGEAREALEEGNSSQAADAMEQMAEEMAALDAQMQESELLEAAMAEMQMAKDAMASQAGSGEGQATRQAGQSDMAGQPSGQPGDGMGKGTSAGQQASAPLDAEFLDSQVRPEGGEGPSVYAGEADGPNIRGQVSTSIQAEISSSAGSPADPQITEQLPKSRREHAEEYFDLFREGR